VIFADTNILVYAADPSEGEKCRTAVQVLREAVHDRSLVLSAQVLQEFYVTVLRKQLLPHPEALEALRAWSENTVVPATTQLVLEAAALHAGCTTLFTEDLQHGQRVGDLEIVNPFTQAVHEERMEYLAGSSPAAVDRVLRKAIARKAMIGFAYEGRPKEGEPHDYGFIKGKLRLNFYQTKGRNKADAQESGVWKTLDPGKITQLRLLDRHFGGTREVGRGAHKRWDKLIASVTPR
jgi:predicted nucleic acid-binding protein